MSASAARALASVVSSLVTVATSFAVAASASPAPLARFFSASMCASTASWLATCAWVSASVALTTFCTDLATAASMSGKWFVRIRTPSSTAPSASLKSRRCVAKFTTSEANVFQSIPESSPPVIPASLPMSAITAPKSRAEVMIGPKFPRLSSVKSVTTRPVGSIRLSMAPSTALTSGATAFPKSSSIESHATFTRLIATGTVSCMDWNAGPTLFVIAVVRMVRDSSEPLPSSLNFSFT